MVPAGGHIRASSPNRIVTLNPRFGNSNFVSSENVPGLGFDYPHLAAVSPKNERLGRNSRFRQTVPFGFGEFLLSTPEIVVENPQAVEEAQENTGQVDPDMQAQIEAAQLQAYRAGQRSAAQQALPRPRSGGTGTRSSVVCVCDARWRCCFCGCVFVGQRDAALRYA